MEELTKSDEQLLFCTICKEIFTDPCTIDCQHTFCKRCLTNYTKTRRDALTAKSIMCPTCSGMTKVPRSLQPVDQWCNQFEPSFIIQGLMKTIATQGSLAPVEHHCFACQQIGKTSIATSVCEDCNIMLCGNCAAIHVACPNGRGHVIVPLGSGSTAQLKRREVMCKEHNCLVEFRCKDCQKTFCNICCSVYHWKCNSVVSLDSMIPEMSQVLKETYERINSHVHQTEITLKSRRSEAKDIIQGKSSLELEISRVSQQAMDLIRRNQEKLLSQLDTLTEQQTEKLRGQIEAGEIDLLTYRQYREFINLVLQSNSTMDMFDMYTLCQSGEITDRLQGHAYGKGEEKVKRVLFERDMPSGKHDNIFQLGHFKYESHPKDTPKPSCTASVGTLDDVHAVFV